ncbi:MAG TPA: hypothetical protein VFK07_00030, partial [Candidatus Paceibacterota bacterium]|nr:hypothetical protein [Candidatus Paceibacterota bacterium]
AYEPANKRKEFMVLAAAILVLMTILGTTGFLVASSVDAKETPKEFTVRMYHKFSDGDGDFDQIQAQIREAFAKKWNYR